MKIIISGGSGFVGKNLIKYLQGNGNDIINISRIADKESEITWDHFFKNPISADFDTFIHLAGKAHDTRNVSDPKEYFTVNTELTKKVFDTFLKSNASLFIYMSTVKAVADTVNNILTEDVTPGPQTPYGQSKQLAEEYILNTTIPLGKRVFILRACMIHGPGNKGNLNLLYKFVQKGIPYPLGAFENSRSFLSIDNLCFVIEKLISNPDIADGVYNVADSEPLSTNEVINIIAHTTGLKPKIWKLAPSLIRSFALIGDKLGLPLNSERLKKLTESYVVSNKKIKEALHITHLPVSATEGLKHTIQSFR